MEVVGIALLFFLMVYAGPALCYYVDHRIKLERERAGLPPKTIE